MASPNSVPRFIEQPRTWMSLISTANTNLDGTGTIVDVIPVSTMGILVELIRVQAIVTTTAGMVRLFLHDGSNWRLYDELPVNARTPSASVAAFEGEIIPSKPLVIAPTWKLGAAPHNAESFIVHATGGLY